MNQNDYIGKTLKPWPILVDHYKEINSTIEKGALSRKDYEISVYRNALSKYPEHVRDAILERDKCQDEYYAHIGNHA